MNQEDILLEAEFYHQFKSKWQINRPKKLTIMQSAVLGWGLSSKIESLKTYVMTCGSCTEENYIVVDLIERI